jgi:hypothetical protein
LVSDSNGFVVRVMSAVLSALAHLVGGVTRLSNGGEERYFVLSNFSRLSNRWLQRIH